MILQKYAPFRTLRPFSSTKHVCVCLMKTAILLLCSFPPSDETPRSARVHACIFVCLSVCVCLAHGFICVFVCGVHRCVCVFECLCVSVFLCVCVCLVHEGLRVCILTSCACTKGVYACHRNVCNCHSDQHNRHIHART